MQKRKPFKRLPYTPYAETHGHASIIIRGRHADQIRQFMVKNGVTEL